MITISIFDVICYGAVVISLMIFFYVKGRDRGYADCGDGFDRMFDVASQQLIEGMRLGFENAVLNSAIDVIKAELRQAQAALKSKDLELQSMSLRKDGAYLERNRIVALLASLFSSGIRATTIEGWSPDWHGCVYIDLPCGQASWHYHDSHAHLFAHLPPYLKEYDGHTTEEKYERIGRMSRECRWPS